MQPELQEMIFTAYYSLCDSACSEIREAEHREGTMQKAVESCNRKSFLTQLAIEENIASITRRNQEKCHELLESIFERLGIVQYPLLTDLIRERMENLFGLKRK